MFLAKTMLSNLPRNLLENMSTEYDDLCKVCRLLKGFEIRFDKLGENVQNAAVDEISWDIAAFPSMNN